MENIHYIIFNLVCISENNNIRHILVRCIKQRRCGSTLPDLGPVSVIWLFMCCLKRIAPNNQRTICWFIDAPDCKIFE
jgi:hypothetical protein